MAFVNFTNLTDWQYDTATKKIKHNTGTARITVQALYSEIQNEFDEALTIDDTFPMKYNTPTEYELVNGWTFNGDSDLGYLYGGSIKVNAVNDIWANYYTLGSIESGAVVYWLQNGSSVAAHPGYASGHIDQLIRVTAGGTDIDTRNVSAKVHTWTDTYDSNTVQAPATGGRNPLALATSNDLNNQTAGGTVAAAPYSGITVTFDSPSFDFNQDGSTEPYTATVNCNGLTMLQVYERLKYITRIGETATINGVQGQFYKSANASYTEVKPAPFGTYAGGKFFGARGILLTNYDAGEANNIILTDNNNVLRQAPTSISVKVDSVVSGDRVFLARSSAGAVWKTQFTLNGAHSISGTTIAVNEAVGNDIPSTGVIRIGDDRYVYTSLNRGTKTFSGVSLTANYANLDSCYCPLIDEAATGTSVSKSLTYVADFAVIGRVRKYASGAGNSILPFENTGTVTVAGLTMSAIRTVDTVAS